jgi:ribonuclease T
MKKYTGYKKVFLDVETTGIDPEHNNIFQLSGIVTDSDLNVLESFDYRFRPVSLDHVQPDALEKTGMTLDDLRSFPTSAYDAYTSFIEVLSRHCNRYDKADKLHLVAYNAKFDADFLRAFFAKNDDSYFGSWFWNPPICVMQAAAWMTMRVRGALPNFKLSTLCQCAELGWDETRAHDAQYDIQKTLELFKYISLDIPQL